VAQSAFHTVWSLGGRINGGPGHAFLLLGDQPNAGGADLQAGWLTYSIIQT